jgi:phenylalanyl-tRNA synthetase beta chain
MKISYNWLRDYVQTDKSPETISRILTDTGLEVEGLEKVESIKGGLQGVVIGEVLTCEKHPNADKLSVTTVDVGGKEPLQIVCGAPNVAKGQKVPVATVGTTLYDGDKAFKIKKAKMRGERSEGMICAEDELGLGNSHDGIMVLDENARPGTPAKDYFEIQEDYVFEIGLTPNRTDAMSHIGVARDLVAALNNHPEKPEKQSLKIPDVKDFQVDNTDFPIDIIVEDSESCPRYAGITLSDIHVEESPDWLKKRLHSIGVRPINNLVDISNYVLFETGQPLHFFDADKIEGNQVIVKKLPEGTSFTTLDEVERKLSASDLMICNAKEPMCMAGVFGGIKSGVTDTTTRLFIESACFDAPTIRKTSKYHALQTDASFRFERGVDPNAVVYALKRAAMMVKEIAGGKISSQIKDVYPRKIKPVEINIDLERVFSLIGKKLEPDYVAGILESLDIQIIEKQGTQWKLVVPTYRVDVTREADIVEEILRIYGYNNVAFTEKITSSLSYVSKPDPDGVKQMISNFLVARGFTEIMNNSLTRADYVDYLTTLDSDQNVMILNPLSSELNALRQSLMFGALESVAHNLNRKNNNLRFFEFGKIYRKNSAAEKQDTVDRKYHEEMQLSMLITGDSVMANWENRPQKTGFYDMKTAVVRVLERLGLHSRDLKFEYIAADVFSEGLVLKLHQKQLGRMGKVHKNLLKWFDIKQEVFFTELYWDAVFEQVKNHQIQYEPLPRFPEVRRDLALLIHESVTYSEIQDVAFKYGGFLLKDIDLFDVYQGENIEKGKKSYAVSFILQDKEKTLKDKEIDKVMNKLIKGFEKNLGAEIRM